MYLTRSITARQLTAVTVFFMAQFFVSGAQAADGRIPTMAEMRQLPSYCPNTQIISKEYGRKQSPGSYDAKTKPFVDMYGADFWHLHHYCFGLVNVIRSYRSADPKAREFNLSKSIDQYDYVLKRITANSMLRPELHVKRAQSLVLMKRGGEAVADFKKAISLKADYAPAYGYLSDYYKRSGEKNLALETLEDGLTKVPSDRSLLKRYADLGGKKTFAPVPEATAQEQDGTVEAAGEADSSASAAESAPVEQVIGNETNPYCRFCP